MFRLNRIPGRPQTALMAFFLSFSSWNCNANTSFCHKILLTYQYIKKKNIYNDHKVLI